MALQGRIIKNRIKSIKNTRKITKAMEMVAAAKMQRAIKNVLATRPYSNLGWHFLGELVKRTDTQKHYLLERREIKKVGLILVSSNRGLCGGFNTQVVQKALKSIQLHEPKVEETDFITFGKRGRDVLLKSNCRIIADFEKPDVLQSILDIRPLTHLIINEYRKKTYDKIMLVYTDFVSSLKQVTRVKHLLPIEIQPDEHIGHVMNEEKEEIKKHEKKYEFEYLFEPSIDSVLKSLLPRLVEVQVYQAVLESDASEHSTRMITMKNASEAASDMIYDLTLAYNQARQATITNEIAEISAGQAAIK